MPEGLHDIQPLRVTSRPTEVLCRYLGITQDTIRKLPQNAVVAEIGSGLFQEFPTFALKVRKDLQIVSIDPSLALKQIDPDKPLLSSSLDKKKDPDFMAYTAIDGCDEISYKAIGVDPKGPTDETDKHIEMDRVTRALQIHNDRLKSASKKGGVAAIAPTIPLRSESTDLLIDTFAAGTHLCTDFDKAKRYYQEIIRILKNEGQAIVFPIDTYEDFAREIDDNTRNAKARKTVESIIETLPGITFEFYEQEVAGKKAKNMRVGVRITKS